MRRNLLTDPPSLLPLPLSAGQGGGLVGRYIMSSRILINQGDLAEARNELVDALLLMPDEHKLYFKLGQVNRQLGLTQAAIAAYESAIRIHPGYIQAHYGLASLYRNQQRWDEASVMYEKIAEIDPSAARPYFEVGIMFHELGLFEKGQHPWLRHSV